MDCGVFIPVANNGWIISENSPQYMPTFELNKNICLAAEKASFDFALSMVKFRGYHGKTEFWDYAMEAFTLMAGLAEATSTLRLYASVATPTIHPALVARMTATIADISKGRFGVNIVSGWNKFEYSQMGLWPGDEFYAERYGYSTEYVEVMRKLWDTGRASHHGTYFELDDCMCQPMPASPIPVVCAGQSDRGLQFAAEVGDYNFMLGSLEQLRVARGKLDAESAKTGRRVGGYALFGIVAAPTDQEAVALATHYLDGTDHDALEHQYRYSSNDTTGGAIAQMISHIKKRPEVVLPSNGLAAAVQGACFAVPHLVGSYERIARHLDAVQTVAGMDGVIMTFPEFVSGVTEFGEQIMPLMTTRSALSGAA